MLLLPCNVLDMLDVPSKYLELFVARRGERVSRVTLIALIHMNFSLLKILSEWSRQETSEVTEKWLRCDCEVKDQRKDCQRTTKVLGVDFRIETVTRCCTFHFLKWTQIELLCLFKRSGTRHDHRRWSSLLQLCELFQCTLEGTARVCPSKCRWDAR